MILKEGYEQYKNNQNFINDDNFGENTQKMVFSILEEDNLYLNKIDSFLNKIEEYSKKKWIEISEEYSENEELQFKEGNYIYVKSNNPHREFKLKLWMDTILYIWYKFSDKNLNINLIETSNKNWTNFNFANWPKFKNSWRYILKKIIDIAKNNNKIIIKIEWIDRGSIWFYKKILKELKVSLLIKEYNVDEKHINNYLLYL